MKNVFAWVIGRLKQEKTVEAGEDCRSRRRLSKQENLPMIVTVMWVDPPVNVIVFAMDKMFSAAVAVAIAVAVVWKPTEVVQCVVKTCRGRDGKFPS
jgi:hypothetical protein